MNKQTGFTLVEIAIVMVIIGLLLGGVLKGQQIILDAKLKNLENQFQGTIAAYYTYLDRYSALAGDHQDARVKILFGTNVGGGDGNRKIATGNTIHLFDSTTTNQESRLFWLHLRNAGLVSGAPDDQNQPANPFGGVIGVSTGDATTTPSIRELFVGFSNIPRDSAVIIDLRRDDGNEGTGSVQATPITGSTTGNYGNTDSPYNMFFKM